MSTSIKVIKFTSILSIVFLLATYLITVNIESKYIKLNTIWISNNFWLTIFGGVFASTLVVLFCEINKYLIDKKNTENQLFVQTMYLYQTLFLMKHNIHVYQEQPDKQIPENLLDTSTHIIKSQAQYLQGVDYSTFKKNNIIEQKHISLKKEAFIKLSFIENEANLLKSTILEVKMENLNNNKDNCNYITASDERVAIVLSDQIKRITLLLDEVDSFLKTIDNTCNNRYDWDITRKTIVQTYMK